MRSVTAVRAWLFETHSPLIELTRHFFLGLFRSESFAGDESFTTWIVQILALLIAASWLIPVELFRRYAELHMFPDSSRYLTAYSSDTLWLLLVMTLLMAFVTVVEWPSLFPSQRDHLVLSPLPLTRLQIFGGKAIALFFFFSIFLLSITLLSSIALPVISAGQWETRGTALRIVALLLAALGGGYFVFLSLVGIQGLLLMLLPARWFPPVSFGIQMVLLLILLCAMPVLPYFPTAQLAGAHSAWLNWLPPAWFWGLNLWIIGSRDIATQALAIRAGVGIVIALIAALGTYMFSYFRITRLSLECRRRGAPLFRAAEWIARMFGQPEAQAVSSFVAFSLFRGRRQKLIFLLIAGMGLAVIFEDSVYLAVHAAHRGSGESGGLAVSVVALPLTLSFFSMVALRRVFRIPVDLGANWIFQFLEQAPMRPAQLDAVFGTFVMLGGIAPLLLCLPIEAVVMSLRSLLEVLFAQALMMLTLAEYLFASWKSIPFTFAQDGPRRHFIHSLCAHLVELSIYSFLGAGWIVDGVKHGSHYFVLIVATTLLLVLLHKRRSADWGREPLVFVDGGSECLEVLRLSS